MIEREDDSKVGCEKYTSVIALLQMKRDNLLHEARRLTALIDSFHQPLSKEANDALINLINVQRF